MAGVGWLMSKVPHTGEMTKFGRFIEVLESPEVDYDRGFQISYALCKFEREDGKIRILPWPIVFYDKVEAE